MEEKKKTTTKKTTTKKEANVKKETEKVVQETPQPQIDMSQMFAMFQQFMNAQQQVNQEQPKKESVKSSKKETVKKNKSYLRKERGDDEVAIKSVAGTVCFKSPKSGITYNWLENGDEEYLSVDEILQMETASKKYLHTPWLVIEDDEINEVLGIKEINSVSVIMEDVVSYLEDNDIKDIEDMISKASVEFKETFAGEIVNKIKDETLRDGVLIRELGRMLNIDFELYK